MNDLVSAYIEYLSGLKQIKKPKMPTFDVSAYNDIEYKKATQEIVEDFAKLEEDELEYVKFLKGD